jgi:hypothetical protein
VEIPIAVRPITGLQLAPAVLVRRVTLVAWLAARNAVRANIPEVAYLRTQHALYRATAPRDVTAPIPETEISSMGDLVVRFPGGDRHPSDTIFDPEADLSGLSGPVAAEAAYQRNASQAAAAAVARMLEEKESDHRTADRQVRECEDELEHIQAGKARATRTQTEAFENGADVDAPLAAPSLGDIVCFRAFEFATIAGEAMNAFAALANTAGLDPSNLPAEWANGAAPAIIGWAVAGMTMGALLFVIAEWAFARIATAMQTPADPTRAFRLTTAIAALAFDAGVVAAIAYLRAQLGTAGHVSMAAWCVYFLLGAAPLIGGALVHLHTNTLIEQRAEALRVAATPSAADLAQQLRSAREEMLLADRDRLRARRDQLVNAIQLLNAQMHGAEQAVRDIARHETGVVLKWLDSLRSALAKDQKHYQHFARAWNRTHLLAGELAAPVAVVPQRKRRAP